jgi:prepilin-type N-terminal cleavage/methylation domain-containing protein
MTSNRGHSLKLPGFTLVELLVVVGIIALLISILLPSLARARDQSRLIKCLAHMRGAAQAAQVFADQRGGRFQIATDEVGLRRADPNRSTYGYDKNRELTSWPVALAQATGIDLQHNIDWGIKAVSFIDAWQRRDEIDPVFELLTCPSDKVRISTPFYPRNKGGSNNGLKMDIDGSPDGSAQSDEAYWGYLSFGLNEDIAGAEVEESNGNPACWRAELNGDEWIGCKGEFGYPPNHPCGKKQRGRRLRGRLERVFAPSVVGLVIEAGPDTVQEALQAQGAEYANLIISAQTEGPYLADFQQRFGTRMPSKRHFDGKINVLAADLHGETILPIEFSDENDFNRMLPSKYSPNFRVSPYEPHAIND